MTSCFLVRYHFNWNTSLMRFITTVNCQFSQLLPFSSNLASVYGLKTQTWKVEKEPAQASFPTQLAYSPPALQNHMLLFYSHTHFNFGHTCYVWLLDVHPSSSSAYLVFFRGHVSLMGWTSVFCVGVGMLSRCDKNSYLLPILASWLRVFFFLPELAK